MERGDCARISGKDQDPSCVQPCHTRATLLPVCAGCFFLCDCMWSPLRTVFQGCCQEELPNNRPPVHIQANVTKKDEWRVELWIATADFRKAFDSIEHFSTWTVPSVNALQTATVMMDVESERFEMWRERGRETFFELTIAMTDDAEIWRQGLGVKLGDEKTNCISDPRLADDVMLMTSSMSKLRKMMTDLKRSSE